MLQSLMKNDVAVPVSLGFHDLLSIQEVIYDKCVVGALTLFPER